MHVFVIESACQNKIPIFYSIGTRQKFDLFKVSFILWPLKYFFVHSILAGLSLTLLAIQYKIFSPFRRNLSVCRSLVNQTYTIANGQPTHKCRGVSAWLCLACCGFGIWCHLYSFPLGHTYTNQWDTPISNSLDSRTHQKNNRIIRFRFICVHVVLQIRIQDRERCGLFAPYLPKAASIACLCACMRVCVCECMVCWRGYVPNQNIMTWVLLMGKLFLEILEQKLVQFHNAIGRSNWRLFLLQSNSWNSIQFFSFFHQINDPVGSTFGKINDEC